jgi:hypothetical protein
VEVDSNVWFRVEKVGAGSFAAGIFLVREIFVVRGLFEGGLILMEGGFYVLVVLEMF